jgi:hypothetical protein
MAILVKARNLRINMDISVHLVWQGNEVYVSVSVLLLSYQNQEVN